jgi:endonuclease/exonuclease/phosphatase family metal-dependent hydrolase
VRRAWGALGVGLLAAGALAGAPAAEARVITVVQANVGNVNVPACNDQVFKLCLREVERRAGVVLRALRPDVVAFQEILPPALCAQRPSPNSANLCSGPLSPASQVQRLLGAGYAHGCDDRFGWDCIAVASRAGSLGRVHTRPVLSQCADRGFTLPLATVRVDGWPVTVTAAHPDSMNVPCRTAQLRDLFEGALPPAGAAIVMGDFNLDPYRESDESASYWRTQVPARFAYASGDALTSYPCTPSQVDTTGEVLDPGDSGPCAGPLASRTIDHVVVRGGVGGRCSVHRIDGGGGMDHRAQVCRLDLGPAATPAVGLTRAGVCTVAARLTPTPAALLGVRFRVRGRNRVDLRPPYTVSLRRLARTRKPQVTTVTATPLLANGEGPVRSTRQRSCVVRRP